MVILFSVVFCFSFSIQRFPCFSFCILLWIVLCDGFSDRFCWTGKQGNNGNPLATDLETTLAELIGIFCFGSCSCYFWLNFFVVTYFDPYFLRKIAGALSLVRFESSKKIANLIFVKTSNGHNFCSGYQNRYYYICIWGRKKFPIPWQPP